MRKIVFALILLFYIGIMPVFACEPPTDTPDYPHTTPVPLNLSDYVEASSLIFVGTAITGMEHDGYNFYDVYEIRVSHYLKGEAGALLYVNGNYYDPVCNSRMQQLGHTIIYFVTGNPDEVLSIIHMRGQHLADEILALTNQLSVAPSEIPVNAQVRFFIRDWDYVIKVGSCLLSLLILGFVLIAIMYKSRSSKAKREELL